MPTKTEPSYENKVVLFSQSEYDNNDGAGFWCNVDGWTVMQGAQAFRRDALERLPMAADDVVMIPYTEVASLFYDHDVANTMRAQAAALLQQATALDGVKPYIVVGIDDNARSHSELVYAAAKPGSPLGPDIEEVFPDVDVSSVPVIVEAIASEKVVAGCNPSTIFKAEISSAAILALMPAPEAKSRKLPRP